MAMQAANQIRVITASGGGTLTCPPDQSWLVKDIKCIASSNDTYLTILINAFTVAYLRVKTLTGSLLPYTMVKTAQVYEWAPGGILNRLRKAGMELLGLKGRPENSPLEDYAGNPLDIRFPIAAGQSITVKRYAETGHVCLIMDVYDAGDVHPDLPNGTASSLQRYLNPGLNVAFTTAADLGFSASLLPNGMPAWPFDASAVPQNTQFTVNAIVGGPVAKGGSTTNKGYTSFLKLYQGNDLLFDADGNGLPFRGDSSGISAVSYVAEGSVIGPGTDTNPGPPLILSPGLVFPPGQVLAAKFTIVGGTTGGPAAGDLDFALVLERKYGS